MALPFLLYIKGDRKPKTLKPWLPRIEKDMSAFSFFIRTFLKVIIILLPLVYYEWFGKYINIVIIVFIIVFFIVQYLLVYKPIKNISNTRKSILDFLFKNWVEGARLNRKRPKIRISIMQKKFYWTGYHFFQCYQFNMKDYLDCNLHFSIKKGFIGECFDKDVANAPYLCDLRQYTKKEILEYYNFDEKLYAETSHIKAMACIPLQRRIKSFWRPEIPKYKKFGVLCVDAVDETGADFLSFKKVLQEIGYFSKFVQILYS